MKPIKSFLEQYGIHSFLLPVFFILHSYRQYYGLVDIAVAVEILGELILFFLIFFLLALAITKNLNKSLQLITLFGFVYLFYGVIKDFVQLTLRASFFSKYSVLLPSLIIATIILARVIFKKKDFRKTNLFQNSLLIIFILIDGIMLIAFDNSYFLKQNLLTRNSHLNLDKLAAPHRSRTFTFLFSTLIPAPFF